MLEQMPTEAVETLSLEIFKTQPDKVTHLKSGHALRTTQPLKVVNL